MNIEGIKMENSYKYFKNKDCKYFPCHKGLSDDFNCLFCYCPLYALGSNCGGHFTYTDKGIKNCSACSYPHHREHYDEVLEKLGTLIEQLKTTKI